MQLGRTLELRSGRQDLKLHSPLLQANKEKKGEPIDSDASPRPAPASYSDREDSGEARSLEAATQLQRMGEYRGRGGERAAVRFFPRPAVLVGHEILVTFDKC
jgi:hypothetical protein